MQCEGILYTLSQFNKFQQYHYAFFCFSNFMCYHNIICIKAQLKLSVNIN
jgi:hypothetical protein